MELKLDILEKSIDMLLEKTDNMNLSKYDKFGLCHEYLELEKMADDVYDISCSKKSERYKNCISKMQKLNGHFYNSEYSKDYSEFFDVILEQEDDDTESEVWTDPNQWMPTMFPNLEEGEDPFDSYDWDD